MRPLAQLMRTIDELDNTLGQSPKPFHFAVVGGGASGCELALALHHRLGRYAGFQMTLLQGNNRLLPQHPARAARAFQQALQERGILVRLNARVVECEDGYLRIDGGEKIPCDAVLWATDASPPPVLRQSGLALNAGGFLRVADTLQSISNPGVFGTGDCVSFQSYPDLPKNGVHAVREGAVLFDNVASFLHEQPLRPFRPQRFTLNLLNTADGQAILSYGPIAWKSRWARKLKDRIDRRWIAMFTQPVTMTAPADGQAESYEMRCGGCGSKISSDVLSAVLKRIDVADDPRVLLGCRAGEDAAVYRMRPDLYGEPDKLVEVQTVDYFKAFIDDPFLFGRIAALNAVSDLYAMNARPFSALAIATLPYARGPVQAAQLYELLCGAVQSLRELGVVLAGGHTTEGSELALGFSVTGYAEADRLFQKSNLHPADCLILTKPLGSGALLAAWMRGQCKAGWFEKLVRSLLIPNKVAAEIFQQIGVRACTDVTGFGLAGHLLEMLDASRVTARLNSAALPLFDGFAEVVSQGIVSSLHRDNAKVSCRVHGSSRPPDWLFDPQTSGGLLAAVPQERVEAALHQLHQSGYENAAVIGEILSIETDVGSIIHLL
jgi:selenide,water dikinase